MAKKRLGRPPMPATDVELRPVRLHLPVEEHKRLRRLAADQDTNMALLTRKIVMEYIARHPLKGEGRSS
jgi:hypothetical protein